MRFKNILFAIAITLGSLIGVNAQQPQTHTAPLYAVNAKYTNGVAPGYAPTQGTGLVLNLGGGTVDCDNTIVQYAPGALTLADNATNYVYLDTTSSCAPTSNTSGFTSFDIPIAVVTTSSGSISNIIDDRTAFSYRPGGSGTQVSLNSGSAQAALAITGFMPQACTDTTGSDFDQSCTTATGFVPQSGNCFVYSTNVTNNSPSFNISINGSSNIPVAMSSATGFTTTLNDFSFPTHTPVMMCYDGTNLNASPSGVTPGGFVTGYQVTQFGPLNIEVAAGSVNCAGSFVTSAQQQFTLTPSATNYVFLNTASSCALTVNTTGFGTNNIPIAAITATINITNIQDQRTAFTYNAGIGFPGAGVANSTGTSWGTSYQVGISANDLVQLNGSAQLPALNGSLLTNLPFQSLSTTGSGAATLIAGVLNIPTPSGGGGSLPTNSYFVFIGTSMNDDDTNVLSPAVAITAWSTTTGVTTVTNSGTNSFVAGQWVSMRFATGWPSVPSYVQSFGTGYTLFQVLSTGLSSTQFEITTGSIGAGTCASSCGSAYSAMSYLPFATTSSIGMPAGASVSTYSYCASGCTIAGIAAHYTALLHPISPAVTGKPGYLIINGPNNDLATCASAATIESSYQTVLTDAHTDGWIVVVGTPNSVNYSTLSLSCPTFYNTQLVVDAWIRGQGKSTVAAASPSSTAYWDIFTDVGSILNNGSDTTMVASNGGLGPTGAKEASATVVTDLISGGGRPLPRGPEFYGLGNQSAFNSVNGWIASPTIDGTYAFQWWNAARTTRDMAIDTFNGGLLLPASGAYLSIGSVGCPGGAPFCVPNLNIDASGNIITNGYIRLTPPGGGILSTSGPSNSICWNTNGGSTACGSSSIADTTIAVSSGSQGANSCSSTTNVTITGLTTAMVINAAYSANPASLAGWGSTGGMVFQIWPTPATSNTATWQVCNQTGSTISYSAITFNIGVQ